MRIIESSTERLIGWLTIALGAGALIPRQGLGLYAILEDEGWRLPMGSALLLCGLAAVFLANRPDYVVRMCVLGCCAACWIVLSFMFVNASLWGATCQSIVVIAFVQGQAWQLWRTRYAD